VGHSGSQPRQTQGSNSFKISTPEVKAKHLNCSEGYAKFTVDANDILVPARPVRNLNVAFDTLAIDCEGCFATFLEENPDLLQSLTMIMVEAGMEAKDRALAKL
jgi:hypothetical protein